MKHEYNLKTKIDDLPLGKCRKVTLINSICTSLDKNYSNLILEDLANFNIVDDKIFNNNNKPLECVGKVRTNAIRPFILLSKVLKKRREYETKRL